MFKMNKNATRMLTGLILASIVFYSIIQGGLALLGVVCVIVFLGSKEYVKILEHKGFYPSLKMILTADALFAVLSYLNRFDLIPVAFTGCSIAAFLWIVFKGRQPYIANVATTVLGFLYSGWFPLHLMFLRGFEKGLGYVIFMFICVLVTDTGCYYVGKKFGKHKLAPVISPNKTIEGAIGGAICALIFAAIIGHFINLQWYEILFAGLLCTAFAQLGDLSESLIKRDAGVKDSGDILPGHGGFLDRTDSYVLTIPVLYYFFLYFVA